MEKADASPFSFQFCTSRLPVFRHLFRTLFGLDDYRHRVCSADFIACLWVVVLLGLAVRISLSRVRIYNISRRSNKRWRWEWRQEAASGSVPTIHHELLLSREVAPSLPVWWILKMNCFGYFFTQYYWKNSNKFSYHLKKSYICRPERVGDIN